MARPKADPEAVAAARRKAQTEHFNREARATFGIRDTVQEVPTSWIDPQAERREADRLAATHDPTKPSACRLCGVSVAPTDETVANWKCCPPCRTLLPGGLAAVWSDILGVDVEPAEVDDLAARLTVANPCRFVRGRATDPGSAERWEHIDLDIVTNGRAALDEIRVRTLPRRNSSGRGCMTCGVARSTHWTRSPWRWGGRGGDTGSLCADCLPWVRRSGAYSGHDFHPLLLAAACDLRRASWDYTLGIKAYYEADPADPSGTEERWEYLAPVRDRLRMVVLRERPRMLVATAKEQRLLALEATMAQAERRRTEPTRLADV